MGCCGSQTRSKALEFAKNRGTTPLQEPAVNVVSRPNQGQTDVAPSANLSQESDISFDDVHGISRVFPLNPAKITQEYRILPTVLGKGAFGVVHKCIHLITGQERAIKIIMKEDFGYDKQKSLQFIKEIEIMKSLAHPNLVSIYEYFQDEQFIFIVMELVQGIELLDEILKEGRLTETKTAVIMEQLVNAINYIHTKGVVHRDIKPENILVDGKAIKLIDFGGARRFGANRTMRKISGTPFYIAPEVLARSYDARCDLWSMGIVMYIMLTGEPPFPGKEDEIIYDKIRRNNISFSHAAILLSTEPCRDFLKKLLVHNYKERPHTRDIIDHPWLQKVRAESVSLPADIMTNLRKFSVASPFQKAIYLYLVNNVASDVEKKVLIQAFGALDLNHDGVLSKEEIKFGLDKVGINLTEPQLQEVMQRICNPNVPVINYMEFIAATLDRVTLLNEARIEHCFKQFDQDHTGKISIQNFRAMLGTKMAMDDQQWRDLIRVYDLNGDGEIDYSEFRAILIQLTSG
jgi:calcium-dependent protein kinase